MSDEKKLDPKPEKKPIATTLKKSDRRIEIFLNVKTSGLDENTTRALIGFFAIWLFERNFADFTSPKIDKELILKLYHKEVSIEDFVKNSLKDEISSHMLLEQPDSFAKYYFNWKFIAESKKILGEAFTATWDNYAKVKPILEAAYAFWVKDPVKALEEKLKETDPEMRAGQLKVREKHVFTIPAHPDTTFDEQNFLILLEGSISLTLEEKQRVIDAIPRLSIEQINELINIFTEEKQKFSELENEFAGDVQKLKQEREKELLKQENKQEEAAEEDDEKAEAEKIKREMGL